MKPWSEMTPRERDALVGHRVMNLKLVEDMPEFYWSDMTSMPQPIPQYTKSISAAWGIVKKMKERFYEVAVSDFKDGASTCSIWDNDILLVSDGEASTAPEAICIAALRAVGIEV